MADLERWNGGCIGARMLPLRLAVLATLASLSLACSRNVAPLAPAHPAPVAAEEPYVNITPHVSVSSNADDTEEPRAALDPNADVMAEILAIPPGG